MGFFVLYLHKLIFMNNKRNNELSVGEKVYILDTENLHITELTITSIHHLENDEYESRFTLSDNEMNQDLIENHYKGYGKPNAFSFFVRVNYKTYFALFSLETAERNRTTFIIDTLSNMATEWNETLIKFQRFLPKEFDYLKPIPGSRNG